MLNLYDSLARHKAEVIQYFTPKYRNTIKVYYFEVSYRQVQTALNNTAGDSMVFHHAANGFFKDN